MTSYPHTTSAPVHWESRNGYVPPPRFQQLRAQESQQQVLQNRFQQELPQPPTYNQQQNRARIPPPNPQLGSSSSTGGSSPSQSPQMSHSRTGSFFSFRGNKQQSSDSTSTAHQRALSSAPNMNANGSAPTPQQYLPSSNNPLSGPSLPPIQGQPPQGIPPSQYGAQQPPLNFASPSQSQQALPQQFNQQSFQQQPPQSPPQQPQQLPMHIQRPQGPPMQSAMNNGRSAINPQQPNLTRSPSVQAGSQSSQSPTPAPAPTAPPLHPEIRSVVQLTVAHAHKIYFSGPLVRRIERQPDGQKPHKDEGWMEIWAQLGGTTLSVWDMKEIQEASKQGKEVPPSYINVTDAFVQVLGSVTVPATATAPAKRYTNVLTLNTAGSNLLLFSCPSTQSLISWAAALRLAAWEKSRLEEIYTAHLIRITLNARDVPTTLIRGKMEGWARVRIAGQTDWKRVWISVQEGVEGGELAASAGQAAAQATMKKKRMSNLFSREPHHPSSPLPAKPMISMFTSPKPKDRKKALMTISGVTQAFGVYPERPELISRSTLLKVEGTLGDEEMAGSLRTREGWCLIMPELENSTGQAAEMLKWIVALHDAFELYGRPDAWTWDPRDPISLMFGYPVGPQKETLFLDREVVESMDPRDDRTSVIRTHIKKLLREHMKPAVQVVQQRPSTTTDSPPLLPPIGGTSNNALPPLPAQENGQPPASGSGLQSSPLGSPQLPPLSFGAKSPPNATPSRERPLTPITEMSVNMHGRSTSVDAPSALSPSNSTSPQGDQAQTASPPPTAILDGGMVHSPLSGSSPPAPAASSLPPSSTLTSTDTYPSSSMPAGTSYGTFDNKSLTSMSSSAPMTSPKPEANKPFDGSGLLGRPTQGTSTTSTSFTNEHASRQHSHASPSKSSSPLGHSPTWQPASTTLQTQNLHSQPSLKTAQSSPGDDRSTDFLSEAGALYYMQQSDFSGSGGLHSGPQQRRTLPDSEGDDDSTSLDESDSKPINKPVAVIPQTQERVGDKVVDTQLPRHGTPMAFSDTTSRSTTSPTPSSPKPSVNTTTVPTKKPIGQISPSRSGLGRKPSGARAPHAVRSRNNAESISSQTVTETDESMASHQQQQHQQHQQSALAYDDPTARYLRRDFTSTSRTRRYRRYSEREYIFTTLIFKGRRSNFRASIASSVRVVTYF
ncbi:hypothetical protein NLJ89_g8766 [Agrocybe chaxingu]|uniref:PH domain-containing protein n=1 Tax=Agrocybe chaxingu TaxID=84603 RepID=A0A9W8MU67_9AGAR|nr:hypothetical protein NLJ89_g8766 [Agrocybe chaxingu]